MYPLNPSVNISGPGTLLWISITKGKLYFETFVEKVQSIEEQTRAIMKQWNSCCLRFLVWSEIRFGTRQFSFAFRTIKTAWQQQNMCRARPIWFWVFFTSFICQLKLFEITIVIPDQNIWKQFNMFSSMFEVAEDYVDLVERCSFICLFPWIICMPWLPG